MQEDKIIKSFYDDHSEEKNESKTRRFSCAEQKISVERLTKTRGGSFSTNSKASVKKLMPEDLSLLVKRLYKVKEYPKPAERVKIYKKNKPRKSKNEEIDFEKISNELKMSKRYKNDEEKQGDNESIVEFNSEHILCKSSDFDKEKPLGSSPKMNKNRDVENTLEVKLLTYNSLELKES